MKQLLLTLAMVFIGCDTSTPVSSQPVSRSPNSDSQTPNYEVEQSPPPSLGQYSPDLTPLDESKRKQKIESDIVALKRQLCVHLEQLLEFKDKQQFKEGSSD